MIVRTFAGARFVRMRGVARWRGRLDEQPEPRLGRHIPATARGHVANDRCPVVAASASTEPNADWTSPLVFVA